MELNIPRRNACEAFVSELTRFEKEPGIGFQALIEFKSPPSIRVIFMLFLTDGNDPVSLENHKLRM